LHVNLLTLMIVTCQSIQSSTHQIRSNPV
jgi:hypothetical protein